MGSNVGTEGRMGVLEHGQICRWRHTFKGTSLLWKVNHHLRIGMEIEGLVAEGEEGRFEKNVE